MRNKTRTDADSPATARAYAAKLEARDDGQFPFYGEIDEVVVGEPCATKAEPRASKKR
jgi:hypothetical protein